MRGGRIEVGGGYGGAMMMARRRMEGWGRGVVMGWLVDPDLEVILDGIEGMSRATLRNGFTKLRIGSRFSMMGVIESEESVGGEE